MKSIDTFIVNKYNDVFMFVVVDIEVTIYLSSFFFVRFHYQIRAHNST